MKQKRHRAIRELIKNNIISTQDELLEMLSKEGFDVTQATVSRDINEMRLSKITDKDGNYRYTLPLSNSDEKFTTVLYNAVDTVDFAGNMVVIKCPPGMAPAVCASIDKMELEGLLGTIAGDDTIFAVCKTEKLAVQMTKLISGLVK